MAEENTTSTDVVIVEDQPELAEIYKTRLEMLGFRSATANDGLQALIAIEQYRPRLVLLDLMLPKLPGDQVLKVMRSTDWGEDIKVLIISNLNESEAPTSLRDLGIEGYIVKANMTDGELDKIVGEILKPVGQREDVAVLEGGDS